VSREVLRGTVQQRRYAPGSKSEHDAVTLVTADGEFRLQRKDANPFDDPGLREFVGKRVEAAGFIAGPALIVDDLREIGE
jgi:hypothetical protein